jgi:hypothetical protein
MNKNEQSTAISPGMLVFLGAIFFYYLLTNVLNVVMIYPVLKVIFNALNLPMNDEWSIQLIIGVAVFAILEMTWKKVWKNKHKYIVYTILYALISYYLHTHPDVLSDTWTLIVHVGLVNAVLSMIVSSFVTVKTPSK